MKSAPYDVGAVANFMIGRSLRRDQPISYRRLQNLVYISYGIYFAVPGTPTKKLFRDPVEAWKWGPVVPALYHEFKRFGPSPIHKWSMDYDYKEGRFLDPIVSDDDQRALIALDFTWHRYLREPDSMLRHLILQPGTPWDITRRRSRGRRVISDKLIRHHYWELYNGIFRRPLRRLRQREKRTGPRQAVQ